MASNDNHGADARGKGSTAHQGDVHGGISISGDTVKVGGKTVSDSKSTKK